MLLTSILYVTEVKFNFLIGGEVFVTVHTEFLHPFYCFNQILSHLDCSNFQLGCIKTATEADEGEERWRQGRDVESRQAM